MNHCGPYMSKFNTYHGPVLIKLNTMPANFKKLEPLTIKYEALAP